MNKFFKNVKAPKYLQRAESVINSFEQKFHFTLPSDYRNFLLNLEAYIIFYKEASCASDDLVAEHIDNVFCDYYFTLPEIPGEFHVTDLANLSAGYVSLEQLQEKNNKKDLLLIGNIWHSLNSHYFLALDKYSQILLVPDSITNEELNLSCKNRTDIIITKSFSQFLENVL